MSGVMQGLIQSVFELHDGSGIVVTVGKYVTPNHKDINGNGIEPDYNRLPGTLRKHQASFVAIELCNVIPVC
jgi:C-terminal processing protease CtpA/Prc